MATGSSSMVAQFERDAVGVHDSHDGAHAPADPHTPRPRPCADTDDGAALRRRVREAASPTKKQRCDPRDLGSAGGMAVKVDVDDVTCPVCIEPMQGPIFQCNEGHLVCEHCLSCMRKPLKCPLCRVEYPGGKPARNRFMESVVAKLPFPCPYGCGFRGSSADMPTHVTTCPARTFTCYIPSCQCSVTLRDLKAHVEAAHSVYTGASHTLHGFNRERFDRFTGIRSAFIHAETNSFIVWSVNYYSDTGMTSRDGPKVVVQCRAFHALDPAMVSFAATTSRGRRIAETPCAMTDPLTDNDGSSLGLHVDEAKPDRAQVFMIDELLSMADGGDVAFTLHVGRE